MSIKKIINMFEKVKSSQITAIEYIEKERRLNIKFKNNSIYSYCPIEKDVYLQMLTSESIGSYFYKNIKNNKNIKTTKISNG